MTALAERSMLSHAKLHLGTDDVRPQVSHEQPENRVADNVLDGVLCVLELLEGVRCVLEAVETCALYAVDTAGDALCAEGGGGCAEGGGGCAEGSGGCGGGCAEGSGDCAKVVEVVPEVVPKVVGGSAWTLY